MGKVEIPKKEDNQTLERSKSPIYRSKRIVLFGCGAVGASLAIKLSDAGNIIKIIDKNSESFKRLPVKRVEATSIVPILGDGTKENDLRKASAHECDVFLALTKSTAANLMSAQIARHNMRVPKVMCLVLDENLCEIYSELGLEVINPSSLLLDDLFSRSTG
jgi:trk system potassium uptake protein TrkA